MKTERVIARVRAMLTRAETLEEMSRLTNLLVILQKDRIVELEKKNAPIRSRKK